MARKVNAEGAGIVAEECATAGVHLVHFSTNFVFDGTATEPYLETDAPSPLGVYARSKLEGEQRVQTAVPDALLIRSAALYGGAGSAVKGGSFPSRIVARARSGEPLRVVNDQRVNPTYTRDLAQAAVGLVDAGMRGLVHVVAAGCSSYWEFAVAILETAGLSVQPEPVSSEAFAAAAPRPLNGCLRSSRVPPLRHWREALRDYWPVANPLP
jgi:dTDP-4-dehydrorhamnose reductase